MPTDKPQERRWADRSLSLQELALALPPSFAEACGYRGHARHVGLCWIPDSLQLLWSDDGHAHTGRADAFLAWCGHSKTDAALAPFHSANSSSPIRPWLLIDRDSRCLSFGSAADVWAVLERQVGDAPTRPGPP